MTCTSVLRLLKIAVYTVILPAPLTSCLSEVFPRHVVQAAEICKAHGGWSEISVVLIPKSETGRCADGTPFEFSRFK